jgi:hypothetical protein
MLILGLTYQTQGQEMYDLHPCGTVLGRSPWLINYQANPHLFARRTGETLYVPLTIHIVGNNDGSNFYREQNLVQALCTLNADFAPSGIQFYVPGPIRYIRSTEYSSHTTIHKGAEMMFKYNVPNTINTYFVGNASSFCGYNLPYAGIAISQNCAKPSDHTWAHEIGHHFAIPHPFLGWEGGVSWNGSVAHNYNNPAPEKVLYDYTLFKNEYYPDTLIIDTAWVERLDGSNCAFAADGFCDTHPDYLYQRWQCSAARRSNTVQTDPTGEKFTSDASLIMSYAFDQCSAVFTPQQMDAMRAYLTDVRYYYLSDYTPPEVPSTETIRYLRPAENSTVFFRNVTLEWEPVENATAYLIQISTSQNFGIILADTIVYEHQATFESLRNNTTLHWRVKPLNSYHSCTDFSGRSFFSTSSVSHTTETDLQHSFSVYPTLVQNNTPVRISNRSGKAASVQVSDMYGRLLYTTDYGDENLILDCKDWMNGTYILRVEQQGWSQSFKILIAR